jgi:hypothetical protein
MISCITSRLNSTMLSLQLALLVSLFRPEICLYLLLARRELPI